MMTNPAAITSSPPLTSARLPSFFPRPAPTPLKTAAATAYGSMASPARISAYPSTNCRYWVSMNITAPAPKAISRMDIEAPVKLRSRNRKSGSIGSSRRRSQSTKATSAATATAMSTQSSRRSMMTYTAVVSPTQDSSTPTGSSLRAGPRVSGIRISAADAHQRAGGDELPRLGGEDGSQRRPAEQDEADDQEPAAAVPVRQASRRQQQPGEGQHVDVQDPLDVRGRGPELLDQRGDGEVEDGAVHRQHHQRETQDGEHPPATWISYSVRVHSHTVRQTRTVCETL